MKHVPKQLRGDREIVSCAVKRDGLMLEYASPELRNDPEIVSAAISNVGAAFKFASESLRNDIPFILSALELSPSVYLKIDDSIKTKEFVIEAMQHNGMAIKYVDPFLKCDKDIVKAAVKNNGMALKYVGNREFVSGNRICDD